MWARTFDAEIKTRPPWIYPGCSYREFTTGGVICCTEEEWNEPPERARWASCGDCWHLLLRDGEMPDPREIFEDDDGIRVRLPDGTLAPVVGVRDVAGRLWNAPRLIGDDGATILEQRWGVDENGAICRRPTQYQRRLLGAIEYCAETVRSAGSNRQVEIELDAVALLVSACYYVPEAGVVPLEILDDRMIFGYILACVGGSDVR